MKRYLQCAEQQVSLSKLTKYCACHEKSPSWLILVTHETLFTMPGATGVILQHHRIFCMPRKMTLQMSHFSKTDETSGIMRDRSENDPTMIWPWNRQSATRLATEVTFRAHHEHFVLKMQNFALRLSFHISRNAAPATKSDTWTSPNTAPATTNGSHDHICETVVAMRRAKSFLRRIYCQTNL